MKDQKKIKRNLIIGIVGQVIAVLLGVILPKHILEYYGSEINGLLSSVTNIYAYIAIVEAGVAAATCQALYKPVAGNDYDGANEVIAACHYQYRKIGGIYVGLIGAFSLLYPLLIKTKLSFGEVALIILFNGLGNAINFFFHGKYLILLKADGKQYIRSILDTTVLMIKQIVKIRLINAGFDVVVVQSVSLAVSILQMLWITYYIKRYYSWINLKIKPKVAIISQSKYVMIHEVNYLISANLDTMLLTFFADLRVVSVYALYTMIYGLLTRVLYTIRDAFEFKIAYEFHRCKKAFLRLFEIYEVCYITLATSMIAVVNYLILPFLQQYTAGIQDINYIDESLPLLFALVNLFAAGRYPSDAIIHIAGHFRQTKNSAIIETCVNIGVSTVLVQFWGIAGVLTGTIVSALFRMVYLVEYVSRKVIERNTRATYLCWSTNLLLLFIWHNVSSWLPVDLTSYFQILLFGIPYACITVTVFVGINFLVLPDIIKNALLYVKDGQMVNGYRREENRNE